MKNQILKSIAIFIWIFLTLSGFAQSQCVQCDPNSSANGNYSSVLGMSAVAEGQASFASGLEATSLGNYSIALGKYVTSDGASSVTIGRYLEAIGSPAMVIGTGADLSNMLINNIGNSLMIGFSSNKPTLFIGKAPGNGYTGSIGIGDITTPQAKLHIKADDNEPAALFIEPYQWGGSYAAYLRLGTPDYGLIAAYERLEFKTVGKYVFNDGNIGIGTYLPTEKLDVNGNIKTTGFLLSTNPGAGKLLQSDANGLAAWADPAWNISGSNVYTMEEKVGIGTESPLTSLHVAQGDIYLEDITSGIIMKSPDGKCWRGTLSNNGELVFSEATCPGGSSSVPGKQTEGSWNIYPNPAKERFYIESNMPEIEGFRYEMSTATGVLCQSGRIASQKQTVSTNGLAPGYYTIAIKNKKGEPIAFQVIVVANSKTQ